MLRWSRPTSVSPIYFSEKRPFFLEGVDIFKTPIEAVYTRRIENPDIAVKLSGKIGKTSFGILGAVDDPLYNPVQKRPSPEYFA